MEHDQHTFEISGSVSGERGAPLEGARVVIWWQQIRKRRELAAGESSKDGRYQIKYQIPHDAPQPVLLTVEALSEHLEKPLFSPLTAAADTLEINLALESLDESEWAHLVRSIEPLINGLTLESLVESDEHHDLSFLARELNKSAESLMRVVLSARLETSFKIPAPVFYAFLRQQIPATLPRPLLDASHDFTLIDALVQNIASMIFALSAPVQTQALTGAIALDYIGPQFTKPLTALVTDLQSLRSADLLNQPYLVGNANLSQLLTAVAIPTAKQQVFAALLTSNSQSMRNFWRTLSEGKSGLTAAEAALIQRTLSIGAFVKNYPPLVQQLVQGFTAGTYQTLSDLARLSEADWLRLVTATGAPPGIDPAGTDDPVQVFAEVIYTRIIRAYPTAALTSRIATAALVPAAQQAPLTRFFTNNADLNLLKDNIPVYLAAKGDAAYAGINVPDRNTVLANARCFQRTLRIAPDADTAQVLIRRGWTSATQIAALGQQQFVTQAQAAGLNPHVANQVYASSGHRYAAVVGTFMQYNRASQNLWPKALGDQRDLDGPMQTALQTDPSLSTLFGSQDYCATTDCASVLSPAAYLCDLLLWLRNHPQAAGTALDVLDRRRPDIRHLLLNCPNSDTELPFIDLIIELLANAISPPTATTLIAAISAADLTLTVADASQFPAAPFSILIGTEVIGVTAQGGMGNVTWTITRALQGTTAAVAAVGATVLLTTAANPPWKQTPESATVAQLSAAPVYFNQNAFVTLFNAKYPQSLPYSAGLDELRTYLGQWNLPLWQLRQAVLPLVGVSPAQQVAVAAERLHLNVVAQNFIVNANPGGIDIAWNTTNSTTALATVPAFMQAGSITYESLLELLDCEYVVGALDIALFGLNDLCDTSTQSITPDTTLAAGIGAADLSITVADGREFPAPPFIVAIGAELLQVTALAGTNATTWTVVRAQSATVAAAANLGAAVVMPLDPAFLDRANRFLRLWPASGYKLWELDMLLRAPSVGNGTLDAAALIDLQAFWQLQSAVKLSVDQTLSFYQDIDTATHRDPDGSTTVSLYSQIFLNPTTTWIAPDPDLVALPAGGAPGDPILSNHVKALQPALGISAADLNALLSITDNAFTLANLSFIYRQNALATASKLKVSDLLNIAKLLGPPAVAPATALAAPITVSQTTISVTAAAAFGPPNFYVQIGAEILLVTGMGGAGNATWSVVRGQLGSTAAAAAAAAVVTGDGNAASPAAALATLLGPTSSPTATLDFLPQVSAIQQQSGLTLDAINYLLTPPSSITGGWTTSSQMSPANIATTLGAVQQSVLTLLSASTTLSAAIGAGDLTLTVASATNFPAPNFYVYIGAEILLVTAVGDPNNKTWTVARAQLGTTAAAAAAGTTVTPTAGDLNGVVIAAVAANAHGSGTTPIANDVAALILQNWNLPGTAQSLLATLMDPALLNATATITISGSPAAGDSLQATLANGIAPPVIINYALTPADVASVNQTATDFAQAINSSPAVVGPQAFLSTCAVANATITLLPLNPGAPGSGISSANVAAPGGGGHVAVNASTQTIGPSAFANQFTAVRLFDKLAVLVRGLRVIVTELRWLLQSGGNPAVGGLDLTQLPVTQVQPALSLNPLLTTLLAIKLARLWKSAPPTAAVSSVYDIIAGVLNGTIPDVPSTQAALSSITGWPLSDIQSFAAALQLNFPASYTAPHTYNSLRTLEAMSAAVDTSGPIAYGAGTTLTAPLAIADLTINVTSAIGFPAPNFYINIGSEILLVTAFAGADNTIWTVTRAQSGTAAQVAAIGAAVTPTYGAQIVSWAAVPADEISAQAIAASALGVLKAQQPNADAWSALAPTLMNPIRQNQSTALQNYLLGQRTAGGAPLYPDADGLATIDGLFNYFLIDTQMTACQLTSRVVQAYIAVQIFVERCFLNLEAPAVIVNLNADDTWNQWEWMSRYRVWEANREVFLYPENWLIESQRPSRTEIFQKFEQDVRQGESTADYLETTVLNYIDRLDAVAHLTVTGTTEDPATGTIYVIARSIADPPVFYSRTYTNSAWSGWTQIPLDIKAVQVVPALYRGRLCLFWLNIAVKNEANSTLTAPQASSSPPPAGANRYVVISVFFSMFRNNSWIPAQAAKGALFDKPIFLNDFALLSTYNWWQGLTTTENNPKTFEALYSIKIQSQPPVSGYGTNMLVDVFRYGDYHVTMSGPNSASLDLENLAVHIGRATFDGRFSDLELSDTAQFFIPAGITNLFDYAQAKYGPDAQPLLPLTAPDPDLGGNAGLMPQSGAWVSQPATSGGAISVPLNLSLATSLEQNTGPLLNSAQIPFRILGPDTDLLFNSASYFFFQDNRRCYFVSAQKDYWTGSAWSPTVPSYPSTVPYEVSYDFRVFYHPFTRLFWNQLGAGGFDLLYDVDLQQAPDAVDPSHGEVFSFETNYQPSALVDWDHSDVQTYLAADMTAAQGGIIVTNNIWVPIPTLSIYDFYIRIGSEILKVVSVGGYYNTSWGVLRAQMGTVAAAAPAGTAVTPTRATQDRQFLDFSTSAPNAVYNWELFYHVPLFMAQLLSQNQQFEDAQTWYHYIFNPTRQGNEPAPQRFWITKPLRDLNSSQILAQRINNLLNAVNQGDATADAEIEAWRSNPFNPFLLADQRPIAYMKSTVMSYLDNLIAWGDNLFATQSREALSEATLLYVIASEVLGPTPNAVTPPQHADESFDELEPILDDFANAMVSIENLIGSSGSGSSSNSGSGGMIPAAPTFYFKIPSNPTLLNYWSTVADRLFKLRHCEDLAGAPLALQLFDAPIDPGLLVAAQSAGVDLSSVLSNLAAALPNYRFTALYTQALDFVNAVRAYGSSLQAALEKVDAGALTLLQQTTQQQLLADGNQILDWQVQQASNAIDSATQTLALAQKKFDFNNTQAFANAPEAIGLTLSAVSQIIKTIVGTTWVIAAVAEVVPNFTVGVAGFGGSPVLTANDGGTKVAQAAHLSGKGIAMGISEFLATAASVCNTIGSWEHRADNWKEAAAEAAIQITQASTQINSAQLALQIAQLNQQLHQEQIDNIQKQIDFLTSKFTNDSLYDWMVSSLSATYFQSYQLAYAMCKQVERCYQFELGISNSSFIQFGYWDSLHKGLLSGETLNHDLRRMQASYLKQNARRFEISRYVSLVALSPTAFQQLLATGGCDFTLPESLFDNDYPGHYNRRLTRVSVTVIYPNPGKFDNVKASLTLTANQVRITTDTTAGYAENPPGSDSRFIYTYAAVPQKIVLGNAQDDPGLFITAIASNIVDQRYLPFENAGAISSWHLDMPAATNEIDLSTVGDIMLHLYYTALDGGEPFGQAVQANNIANQPNTGLKLFSAQNDFSAGAPSAANPYPVSPWSGFLSKPLTTSTTLAWPINATQTSITVASNSGFPATPFLVQIGDEILNVTATAGTGNTTWTVARAQQGTVAAAATTSAIALLPTAAPNQILTLSMSASKFPAWTRGKTITVTSITVLVVSWQPATAPPPGPFNLVPQAPFPNAVIDMLPVPGVTQPNICSSGPINPPAGTPLGTWSFEIQLQGAANYNSLSKNAIGDVLLLVSYSAG